MNHIIIQYHLQNTFRLYEKFEPLIANVGGIDVTGQQTPWTDKVQIMDILREFPSLQVYACTRTNIG